jgi:DinB family protein
MASRDLLAPLIGQREETLKLLDGLAEADLDREHESGRSVRSIVAHLASAELGAAFVIRRAAEGELVPISIGERDSFNEAEAEKARGWDLGRLRDELADSRESLLEAFDSLRDEDLDRHVKWPEWPARTIRTSIPYILEHEDAHVDEIRAAIDR